MVREKYHSVSHKNGATSTEPPRCNSQGIRVDSRERAVDKMGNWLKRRRPGRGGERRHLVGLLVVTGYYSTVCITTKQFRVRREVFL
jgi:hypothetical protein